MDMKETLCFYETNEPLNKHISFSYFAADVVLVLRMTVVRLPVLHMVIVLCTVPMFVPHRYLSFSHLTIDYDFSHSVLSL